MIIDKLTAVIGWEVDDRALNSFNTQAKGVIDFGKRMAQAAAVAGTALFALGTILTKEKAQNIALAESVGLTADSYLAWEGILKHVGFEGEKVVDLMEEMTNKLGEMSGLGEMTAVNESLQQLSINFKDIKELAPEEQFNTILQAAKDLGDEQIAASAVDMLMGGEANRVVGILRSYEGSVRDILDAHRALNFMTDRGIAGATALNIAFDNITTTGQSLIAEFMGRLGQTLGPLTNKWLDWITANKELISLRMDAVIDKITTAMRWLVWAGGKVSDMVSDLGGFTNALKLVTTAVVSWKAAGLLTSFSQIISSLSLAKKGTTILETAINSLSKVGLIALFAGAALALEDLYVFLTGGKSFFGEWTEKVIPDVEAALLSFFGVIDDGMTESEKRFETATFQDSFLDAINFMTDTFGAFVTGINDGYDFLVKDAESFIGKFVNVFNTAIDGVTNFVSSLMTSIHNFVIGTVEDIAEAISGIPILGDIVSKTSRVQGTALLESVSGVGTPALNSTSIRNQVSNNAPVNVTAPITINAPAGSDTKAIAREVGIQLSAQVSGAVKNLNSGVKR